MHIDGTLSKLAGSLRYEDGELAREQIVAAFGAGLAAQIAIADRLTLPTELIGTRVIVTDSQGVTRNASLQFVSPTQINYRLPAEISDGAAMVLVMRSGNALSIGIVFVNAGGVLKDQPDSN
ncbi:MAG TPA: hypothetical protein PLD20_35455 [Blastocatellia bacterium]|nr:hypothetical protein [Blastocatellia bacterium]HMV87133.1 hypothetical protein [Blastocatellia bacterium]HMY76804.1 hypothetical protein [Blastocatellia bacterium]HMZ23275.1 hypothetical protein [Blastocatellia bacterium]HNG31797.1 hypothetical protein [Blastocatellia bacterium]